MISFTSIPWSKYIIQWLIGLVLTILAMSQCNESTQNPLIERLDTSIQDMRIRLENNTIDHRIIILDIDEKSLSEVGRWPWSRNIIADLVIKLTDTYQAKVVSFDVMFTEPDVSSGYNTMDKLSNREFKNIPAFKQELNKLKPLLDYDGLLAKAFENRPIVLGYYLSNKQKKGAPPAPAFTKQSLNGRELDSLEWTGYEANLEQLQKKAKSGGFFNANVDIDGILRTSQLLGKVGDAYYESLSLATVKIILNAHTIKPIFTKSIDQLSEGERNYGGIDAIALYSDKGRLRIPVGKNLSTMIPYHGVGGPEGGSFRYLSAVDVLQGKIPLRAIQNKIVLIGSTAPGLNDLRSTPVNRVYPGVEVHANLITAMLDNKFKHRPDYAIAIEFIQILFAGIILCIALPILRPTYSIVLTISTATLMTGVNLWLYYGGNSVLRLATLLLLISSLFLFNIIWGYLFEYRNKKAIVNLFGEYVAPELVAQMADHPHAYSMEGENRELTALFVDIRDFTSISEKMSPKALREYLNVYLTAMSASIRNNHGTLDKYIGDAVMAFWGAPMALPEHASRAIETALAMQKTAQQLNQDFIARDWPALKIGIGLNSGPMYVGDMGSDVRRAYTIIGDAVNLASRLEGITKTYGVGIVVGATTKLAAPEFFYRELDCVRVKGKNEPVPIFEPIALQDEVDSTLHNAIQQWHQAYAHIHKQLWDEAQNILEQLQQQYPNELLYKLYLSRIAYYRQHPPGQDWDGVTTFTEK